MRVHTNNSRVPITECTQFEADDDWPNCVRSICILGGGEGILELMGGGKEGLQEIA